MVILCTNRSLLYLDKPFLFVNHSNLLCLFCCCSNAGISLGGALEVPYSLEAPGPRKNAFRLLRAMQLRRPLLLEGAPGVGKTSLVLVLARLSGHGIVRINLSEQTVCCINWTYVTRETGRFIPNYYYFFIFIFYYYICLSFTCNFKFAMILYF